MYLESFGKADVVDDRIVVSHGQDVKFPLVTCWVSVPSASQPPTIVDNYLVRFLDKDTLEILVPSAGLQEDWKLRIRVGK